MTAKKKLPPKPRNPFVAHVMHKSGSGVHDKPYKAKRSQAKQSLRKELARGGPRASDPSDLLLSQLT